MTDYEAKTREIINRWLYLNKDRSLMVESAIATALQEAADEALERAAGVSDEHATFCEREAYNGGSNDLFERARGAEHLAEKIRALKSTPPKGEE
jgi:hypothetical protein